MWPDYIHPNRRHANDFLRTVRGWVLRAIAPEGRRKKLSEKGMQRSQHVYIIGMEQSPYPTDLTDHEWCMIEPLLPRPRKPGRPRKYPWRAILKAIFYVLRTGCQ